MGFLQPSPPPFDLEEWSAKPYLSRLKPNAQDWAVNGFGAPSVVYLLYAVKLTLFSAGAFLLIFYDGDARQLLVDQIERFAPGLRERIVAAAVQSTAEIAAGNAKPGRRGHHHGREHADTGLDPAAPRARSIQHGHTRSLHLLGRHPSRPRRARDERLQRRAGRAAVSAGELAWTSCTSSRSGAR